MTSACSRATSTSSGWRRSRCSMLPALPVIGARINGARLWVKIGPLQFQPGELAKIALIVFLAGYLREKREVLAQGRLKDFGPLLLIWGAAMLVLVETNDLGSALLFFGIFLGMLYVATGRALYVAIGLGLFVAGAAAAYKAIPRVGDRVDCWLHPWDDVHGLCYQTVQGTYSIANGNYWGTGLGRGTFTTTSGAQLIPYTKTDFIYSALAQELGLIGAAGILLVYMVFVLRGFRTAVVAQDGFSKLLAAGLTFAFALQTFIIVGGLLRVIPLTGITLPFVSYGGSSVVANFVLVAGLLLVSNRANAPEDEQADRPSLDRRARAARSARRRDHVLADLGGRRARRPAGQRDPPRRGVQGAAGPRLLGGREAPRGPGRRQAGRADVLLPPLPERAARPAGGRLLDPVALAGRARAVEERLPDRLELAPLDGAPADARQPEGRDGDREQPPADDRLEGAAGRARRARQELRRGGGDRAVDREGARDGLVAVVRPEPRRAALRRDRAPSAGLQLLAGRAARQPRDGRPVHAGLDLQGPDGRGGARQRHVHARLDLRRQGLLHRVRQEGVELRRPERPGGLRARELHDRARALDQRGLLRDREEARPAEGARVRKAVRLLLGPAAGDAVERAAGERAVQPRAPVPPARPERRSTPAGSRSDRSGCR